MFCSVDTQLSGLEKSFPGSNFSGEVGCENEHKKNVQAAMSRPNFYNAACLVFALT